MKFLDLVNTPEKAIVDDQDYDRCSAFKWRRLPVQPIGRPGGRGGYVCCYATDPSLPRLFYLHRFIVWAIPKGEVVDHINGNALDNRRDNLRIVTVTVNAANRHYMHRRNTTGVRGVIFDKRGREKPWSARIFANWKNYSLGTFATIEEATLARQHAELKYYGELCPLPGREFTEWGGMEC